MTDTTSKAEKLKVFADFDMLNRDILMNVLEKHLQRGYMLKHSNQVIGLLTFEPVAEGKNVTYAVIRPALYENGGEFPKPWVKCGRMGDYMIWRSTGAAYIPKPDKDSAELERRRRNINIVQGILWLLIGVMYFATDLPIWTGSARGFSEHFDFKFLRDIFATANGVICFAAAFSKPKRDRTERGRLKYFRQYIVPYILIVLAIGLLIFVIADDMKKEKLPLPDSRLPFSEEFDSGRSAFLGKSYVARNYIYNKTSDEDYMSCFLYEAYFDGLAPKVFDEIRDKGNVYSTENYSGYPSGGFIFINPGTVYSPDISDYPYLDDIIVCEEYNKYDEKHTFGGLIVRSGKSIFGIAYYKDKFSQDEILQYLDEFFAGS